MSTLSIRIPKTLHKKVKELSEKEGISMINLLLWLYLKKLLRF